MYNILKQLLFADKQESEDPLLCEKKKHHPTNGQGTRRILNETHAVTEFPHHAGGGVSNKVENNM